jgi:hypothetical protein
MKVKSKGLQKIPAANLAEVIVSTWRQMGVRSVGEPELLAIQQALGEEMSPAAIARELASAGAELRHPEVIECDAHWREQQIAKRIKTFAGLSQWQKCEPLRLRDAEAAIAKLEACRVRLIAEQDEVALSEIRELAINARQSALNRADDTSLASSHRAEQAEIAEWLRVWLETPSLFVQWVDLRKASPAFTKTFAAG